MHQIVKAVLRSDRKTASTTSSESLDQRSDAWERELAMLGETLTEKPGTVQMREFFAEQRI
jgi:hypothetical protein